MFLETGVSSDSTYPPFLFMVESMLLNVDGIKKHHLEKLNCAHNEKTMTIHQTKSKYLSGTGFLGSNMKKYELGITNG